MLLKPVRGQAIDVVGQKLQDVLPRLHRETLDVEVELTFRRQAYRGTRVTGRLRARLVAIMDEVTGDYHLYLTNVPAKVLAARDVALSYTARWAVELLFRELKQVYRLAELSSSNRHVVEALLHAAILTLIVSRTLRRAVQRRCAGAAVWATPERWARLFQSLAPTLAEHLVGRHAPGSPLQRILAMLRHEAPDVHWKRQGGLLRRVEFASL